jgi:hypothetical protein
LGIRTKGRRTAQTAWAAGTLLACVGILAAGAGDNPLETITSEIVPVSGTRTEYGIPLSLESLPQFVGWWYSLVPAAETDPRYAEALSALVAPCCDDNTAFHCCCETEAGQACNIIRSGKGLAAHLILDLDFTTDQVRESVLQWFRFARWDYYVAAEMVARGIDPAAYGLTAEGSCYRGLCPTPISQGGCGGMQELVEPSIGVSQG